MTPDRRVVAAIEAAVASDPTNTALRLHLAGMLVECEGRAADALDHLEAVLQAEPANIEALGLASKAASAAGDMGRAAAWGRLYQALGGAGVTEPSPDGPRMRGPAGEGVSGTSPTQEPPGGPALEEPALEERALGGTVDWDGALEELLSAEGGARTTLADVAGLEEVKARLQSSFLGPMRNPQLRKMYGATMRGGLLLWGPPGCGKTFLARAVAGELGAHFLSVGLHDVLDMWLGNSEKKVHELFELARRTRPSVLFFDEVDAIGHSRAHLARSAGRNVVAQLLTEMDGVAFDNEGVYIIGATNQPWDVDAALRRPGRLDRTLLVLPPDPPAREAIVRLHLRGRPFEDGSLSQVVAASDRFSGADLRLVCEEAAQAVMAQAVQTGNPRPITVGDLLAAARSVRPSTVAWFEVAENYMTYSNASGEYDELAAYLRAQRRRR